MSEIVERLEKALGLVGLAKGFLSLHRDVHFVARKMGGELIGDADKPHQHGGRYSSYHVEGHPGEAAKKAATLLSAKGHSAKVEAADDGFHSGATTIRSENGQHLYRLAFIRKK